MERALLFAAARRAVGFTEVSLSQYATRIHHSWIGDHVDAVIGQTLAEHEPQLITVRGKPKVVAIAVHDYQSLSRPRTTLVDFFQASSLNGMELDLSRRSDTTRAIGLCLAHIDAQRRANLVHEPA